MSKQGWDLHAGICDCCNKGAIHRHRMRDPIHTDVSESANRMEERKPDAIINCLTQCKRHRKPFSYSTVQGYYCSECVAESLRLTAKRGTVDSATSGRSCSEPNSFWVIERFESGKGAGYWDGASSRSFITDIEKAIHFCRKEDAFWATRKWHWADTQITEHIYLGYRPVINFVQDMIDRAENAHESKPGICVEIPVFMADIARIKQTLRTVVSESANREPQALKHELVMGTRRDWMALYNKAERALQELRTERTLLFNKAYELRAQHEQLTAFSLLQKECVIAAEEMYGACLGAYPNSSETARTEACRKFLQLNDAVGRHPLDDKFLGMSDWKDIAASLRAELSETCKMVALQTNDAAKIGSLNREIASLRGLVGRMLEEISWEDQPFFGAKFEECKFCKIVIPPVKANMKHQSACLISEAAAAIKEPHNG